MGDVKEFGSNWHRWSVLAAGCLVQFVSGIVYGWTYESAYITSHLRRYNLDLTYSQTFLLFAIAILAIAVGGWPAGMLLPKLGPRTVATVGVIILTVGTFLIPVVKSFTILLLVYGAIRGIGIGIVHIVPCSVVPLWFYGRVGMIQGILAAFVSLSGFGMRYITKALVNPNNLEPSISGPEDGESYFDPFGEVSGRVHRTWLILGGIYLAVGLVGTAGLMNPPGFRYHGVRAVRVEGEEEERLSSSETQFSEDGSLQTSIGGTRLNRGDWTLWEAIKTVDVYIIIFIYILATVPGHVTISRFKEHGPETDEFVETVGSIALLAGAVGRLFWGVCVDAYGDKRVWFYLLLLQAVICFSYPLNFVLQNGYRHAVWVCAMYFTYGGNFVVAPSMIWRMFGASNFGGIYGLCLYAWGVGGIGGDTVLLLFGTVFGVMELFMTLGGISLFTCLVVCGLRENAHQTFHQASEAEFLQASRNRKGEHTTAPD